MPCTCRTPALSPCLARLVFIVVVSLLKRKLFLVWMIYFLGVWAFKWKDEFRVVEPPLSEGAVSKFWNEVLNIRNAIWRIFSLLWKHVPCPRISLPVKHLKAHAPGRHGSQNSWVPFWLEARENAPVWVSFLISAHLGAVLPGNSCAVWARQLPPLLGGWRGWQPHFACSEAEQTATPLSLLETVF